MDSSEVGQLHVQAALSRDRRAMQEPLEELLHESSDRRRSGCAELSVISRCRPDGPSSMP